MKKLLWLACSMLVFLSLSSCRLFDDDDDCLEDKEPYAYAQAMVISDYPFAGVSPQFYAKIVFEGENLQNVNGICLEDYTVKVSSGNYSGIYTITDFYVTEEKNNGRLVVEYFGKFLYEYPHINQTSIDRIHVVFSYHWYGKKQHPITN